MESSVIERETAALRSKLGSHPMYTNLLSVADICTFMEYHVFAVWDFMSLLKSLQRHFTTIDVPWVPSKNPKLARFINEIVLGEESDLNELGEPSSHFMMYLQAMEQTGADTSSIRSLLHNLSEHQSIEACFSTLEVDERVSNFVRFTFDVIQSNQPHLIASAFTFGREDIIPELFLSILKGADTENAKYTKLRYYLERHIEIDGDEHGPIALSMVAELCGDDAQKWTEAAAVAHDALQHRIYLWDAITEKIVLKHTIEN
jgi:hypothetical protein